MISDLGLVTSRSFECIHCASSIVTRHDPSQSDDTPSESADTISESADTPSASTDTTSDARVKHSRFKMALDEHAMVFLVIRFHFSVICLTNDGRLMVTVG